MARLMGGGESVDAGCCMRGSFYAWKAVLLGAAIAQVIATIQVYLSNIDLYQSLLAIQDAGYLTIPNRTVMPALKAYGPAFWGGMFFTVSIGLGISLTTFISLWVWDRVFSRNRFVLVFFFFFWLGGLGWVNLWGFDLMVTLYFLIIPPSVFFYALPRMPEITKQEALLRCGAYLAPLVLLAVLWAAWLDNSFFTSARDNFLLSNRPGTMINDFYYKYTLYAAEVFKPLARKTIKTYRLENSEEGRTREKLDRILLDRDYFFAGGKDEVDLLVQLRDDGLRLKNKGKTILQTTLEEFLSEADRILQEYSFRVDRHFMFRRLTFFSILFCIPALFYILGFELCYGLFGLAFSPGVSLATAALLCFFLGMMVVVPFGAAGRKTVDEQRLLRALDAESWRDRVRALKVLSALGMEIGNSPAYRKILTSSHIPERYWLARALGSSRLPRTYRDLLTLLDDPQANVVCMAFYGLGKRGDSRAVNAIIKKIEVSDHWYVQWYAYSALKSLGWRQKRVDR